MFVEELVHYYKCQSCGLIETYDFNPEKFLETVEDILEVYKNNPQIETFKYVNKLKDGGVHISPLKDAYDCPKCRTVVLHHTIKATFSVGLNKETIDEIRHFCGVCGTQRIKIPDETFDGIAGLRCKSCGGILEGYDQD
ncbi:MAG: hypothetical protein K9L74_04630 [Candidatus Izimaplasma sp.]|nr:hypothetical protein [Candidatus Izimaplasma bacterium]